ncbi:MAG: hypothetical protein JEZ03_16625, partial [Bacteroidales bacterium]|nr:hypothetical protein [Bacteroidales bacterium]
MKSTLFVLGISALTIGGILLASCQKQKTLKEEEQLPTIESGIDLVKSKEITNCLVKFNDIVRSVRKDSEYKSVNLVLIEDALWNI